MPIETCDINQIAPLAVIWSKLKYFRLK